MSKREKPAILCVSGVKNSGKTTFIENILPILTREGVRTAVIKHDGHSFVPDVEGTDSFRMRKAGAVGTAVYCQSHYMIIQNETVSTEQLMEQFDEVDLIICEGLKASHYKKFEIVRQDNSKDYVCEKETILAIVSDMEKDFEIPRIELNGYEQAVKLILDQMKRDML